MAFINCDIGERGTDNTTDLALMRFIDMANIACGGHAGDRESVKFFMGMARKYNTRVSAHISYPDKENFGRASMQIGGPALTNALERQWNLINAYNHIKKVDTIKFHGALYNDSVKDKSLARFLACWSLTKGITKIITNPSGFLGQEADSLGIVVIPEFFAERNYVTSGDSVELSSRTLKWASITDLDEAVDHVKLFLDKQEVNAYIKNNMKWDRKIVKLNYGDDPTICIHSDSEIALDLAHKLYDLLNLRK